MRHLSAGLLLLAGASLVAPAPAAAQDPQSIPRGSGGWVSRFIPRDMLLRMQERPSDVDEAVVVAGAPDAVWTALKDGLDALGVPIGFEDRGAGEIGHAQAKLFRRLGKRPLSTYLRCGSGLTGPNADSYQVYLSFVTFVKPLGDGSVAVAPFLTAHAIDVAGARNDPVQCTSTGRLEAAIGRELKTRLGQPAG